MVTPTKVANQRLAVRQPQRSALPMLSTRGGHVYVFARDHILRLCRPDEQRKLRSNSSDVHARKSKY